jgi:hypothetical protein
VIRPGSTVMTRNTRSHHDEGQISLYNARHHPADTCR